MSLSHAEQLETAQVRLQVERLLDVRRPQEARNILQPALSERPEDVGLLILAARIERAEGKPEAFKHFLSEVLRRDPMHVEARVLHFQNLQDEKNFGEAETVMLSLLRESPQNADLLALYAQLMLLTFHIGKCRQLVNEVLRLEPDSQLANVLDVVLLLVEGQKDVARQRLQSLMQSRPEARSVALMAIDVLASHHRHRDALDIAQALVRAAPNDSDTLEMVVELRALGHPAMWPLWPMTRFGWYGSAAMWVLFVGLSSAIEREAPKATSALLVFFLIYVLYSWTAPKLLRRWLKR